MGDSIVVMRFIDEIPDVLNPLRKQLSLYNCTLNLTSIDYLGGSFKHFLFSALFGEYFQFD